jgi:uncharacterized protein (TIGR00369 family)
MDEKKFAVLKRLFEEQIPFNRTLGLKVISAENSRAVLQFAFRAELVGNFKMGILHGGVIAAVLDVVGGAAVIAGFDESEPLHGMGTVDLRVDFLRPGQGKTFTATGQVMRQGRILSSTRMELHNDAGDLIATGAAVYRTSIKDEYVLMNL